MLNQKVIAVVTAALTFVMSCYCLCDAAAATRRLAGRAERPCCQHEPTDSDAPEKSTRHEHDPNCAHCSHSVVTPTSPSTPTISHATDHLLPVNPFVAAETVWTELSSPSPGRHHARDFIRLTISSSLLRLHCALLV
jgi:hypothetical protein